MRKFFTGLILLFWYFSSLSQVNIVGYEYWFNSDFENKVTASVSPAQSASINISVSVSAFEYGIHVFNFRVIDENGIFSSTLREFFYKPELASETASEIVGYEYWFNNNFDGKVAEAVTPSPNAEVSLIVNTDALSYGVHVMHFRTKDLNGHYSSILSEFFYKPEQTSFGENQIAGYEYWFNKDYESKTFVDVTPDNKVGVSLQLSTEDLSEGINVFNFRTRDLHGLYSSIITQYFYKVVGDFVDNNLIVAYRYWFDDDFENAINEIFQDPVNPQNHVASINTPYLEVGQHEISFQYLDENGKWSSILSETFDVETCEPNYLYAPVGSSEVCLGSVEVYNADASLNITQFDWTISPAEAGIVTTNGSSAEVEWSETFSGDAHISVKGSNPCGETEEKTLTVTILSPITVTAMDDESICMGESIELTATSNGALSWSGGETIVSPTETAVYTVTASNICETVTDDVQITVNPLPTLTVMDDATVCAGEPITLTSTSNGTVTWSSGTANVSPSENATYVATATLAGCSVTDEVTISVKQLPTLTVMDDASICSGSSIELTATSNGTIEWSSAQTNVSPTETTTYIVSSTLDGCTASENVIISVENPLEILAMDDTSICLGEEVTLTATSEEIISWNSESELVSPTETTTYTASVSNTCGTFSDEVTVTVKPLPMLAVMDNAEICFGDEIELTAESNGTVTWSVEQTTFIPEETGTYTATAEVNGCIVSDEVTIIVKPLPTLTVMDDAEVCFGDEVELIAESNGTVTWSVEQTTFIPEETETYIATAEINGCIVSDEVTVTVKPLPTLTVMDDAEICFGDEVELTAESNGTVTWNVEQTTFIPEETETYIATAEINGCIVSDEVTVTVKPLPTLTVMDDAEICFGDEVELTAESNGAVTWSVEQTSFIPEETDYYIATASLNGCGSVDSVLVTVKTVEFTVSLDGSTLSAFAEDATFQWVDCNNEYLPINGETNSQFSPQNSGNYAVVVYQNGCEDISDCYQVEVTGIEVSEAEMNVAAFPNPTDGIVKLELREYSNSVSIRVLSSNGETLSLRMNLSNDDLIVDLSSYPAGLYVIEVSNGDSKAHVKVLRN